MNKKFLTAKKINNKNGKKIFIKRGSFNRTKTSE